MASSQEEDEFVDKKRHALVQSARKYFHNRPATDLFQAVWQFLQDEVEAQYQLASFTRQKLRAFASNFIGDENGPGQIYWPLSALGQWQQDFEVAKLEDFLVEVMALVIVENKIQKVLAMWPNSKKRAMVKPRSSKKHRASDASEYESERPSTTNNKETGTPNRRSFSSTIGDAEDDRSPVVDSSSMFFMNDDDNNNPRPPVSSKQQHGSSKPRPVGSTPKTPKGKARADQPMTTDADDGEVAESRASNSPNPNTAAKHVSFSATPRRRRFSDHDHYFSDSSIELGSSYQAQQHDSDAGAGRALKRIKTAVTSVTPQKSDINLNDDVMETIASDGSDSRATSPGQRSLKDIWQGRRDDRSPTIQRSTGPPRLTPSTVSETIIVASPSLLKPAVADQDSETAQALMRIKKTSEILNGQKRGNLQTVTPQKSIWSASNSMTSVSAQKDTHNFEVHQEKETLSEELVDRSQSKSTSCDSHLPSPPLSEHSNQDKARLFDLTVNVPYSLDPIHNTSHHSQSRLPITVSSLSSLPNMIMTYLQKCIDHNIRQAEGSSTRNKHRSRHRHRSHSHSSPDDESDSQSDQDNDGQIDFPLLPEERQYCRTRARVLAAVRMDLDRRIRQMASPIPMGSGTVKTGEGFEFWFGDSFAILEDGDGEVIGQQNTNHDKHNPSHPIPTQSKSQTQHNKSTNVDVHAKTQPGLGIVNITNSSTAITSSSTAIDSASEYEPDPDTDPDFDPSSNTTNSNSTRHPPTSQLETSQDTAITEKLSNTKTQFKQVFEVQKRKRRASESVLKSGKIFGAVGGSGIDGVRDGDVLDLCLM